MRRTIAMVVTCVALGAISATLALADKPPLKGDPARGKVVYGKTCIICHNVDGSGGKKLTPAGNPSRDFRDAKFWTERTNEQLRKTINEGVTKSGMTAWKGILKPQQIEDVLAYVKTFATKDSAKESLKEAPSK